VVQQSQDQRAQPEQPVMGAGGLKLLLQHVPDRGEHLVCYYGWYSKFLGLGLGENCNCKGLEVSPFTLLCLR